MGIMESPSDGPPPVQLPGRWLGGVWVPSLTDPVTRERFIDAWIAGTVAGPGTPDYEANWWAIEAVLVLPHDDPEATWQFLLAVLQRKPLDPLAAANLAAGPLEDLLAQHGLAYIDRVEARARSDSDFNDLLGGVWKNAMPDQLWLRVQQARQSGR
jgi:hypothetical protein